MYMYWISKSIHLLTRFRRQSFLFFAVLGPGLITMVADNDAGGISTYAVTGSKYGFSLLWVFFILVPMAYYVQEMTVRLGAVTKRGHAEAIFEGFGPFWGWFSLVDLAIINWLTLVTEYIGMTAAMSLFGINPWITYFVVTAILFAVVMTGRYWTFEKLTLFFCAFNLVYIPAAFWAMKLPSAPSWELVGKGLLVPTLTGGLTGDMLFIILANIGTTITPWQIFFQQSSVVDKGLDLHDIKMGKVDTFVGALVTCIVAAFIIIVTGAAFYYHQPPISIEDAAQTAEALAPLLPHGQGELARKLFAIGLFDAGFLGALCISLSTSWAVGEVFGWAHSLNRSVREAPWFYVVYLGMLLSAGAVVLIPNAPLIMITMFVQVVAVTLLPSALIFLVLILNSPEFMGDRMNTRWQNIANWSIIIFVTGMSTLFALSTLFPQWFGGTP
ncbi:MAG TPA: divalent metal cation transporter [Candidatus Baltobacteraceae bacterium]|nr:divalent metal cation transporter [Candidatus Baltobacteraceae bacterium]